MTGQRKDTIWNYFIEIKDIHKTRAKCLKCSMLMAGLVKSMKLHKNKCISILEDSIVDEQENDQLTGNQEHYLSVRCNINIYLLVYGIQYSNDTKLIITIYFN